MPNNITALETVEPIPQAVALNHRRQARLKLVVSAKPNRSLISARDSAPPSSQRLARVLISPSTRSR